jgi:hypothetical protein
MSARGEAQTRIVAVMPLRSVAGALTVGDWIWITPRHEKRQVRWLESGKRRIFNSSAHARPAHVMEVTQRDHTIEVSLDLCDGGEIMTLQYRRDYIVYLAPGPGLPHAGSSLRRRQPR